MKDRKANAMINNFWSFKYIYERLRVTAENHGIKTRKKEEKYTSKTCSLSARKCTETVENTEDYTSVKRTG